MPRSAIAASVSCLSVEKASTTLRGTRVPEPPARVRLVCHVSEFTQATCKLRQVDRADGRLAAEEAVIRHLPSTPCTITAITVWVRSCGSRFLDVSCLKVAAAIF